MSSSLDAWEQTEGILDWVVILLLCTFRLSSEWHWITWNKKWRHEWSTYMYMYSVSEFAVLSSEVVSSLVSRYEKDVKNGELYIAIFCRLSITELWLTKKNKIGLFCSGITAQKVRLILRVTSQYIHIRKWSSFAWITLVGLCSMVSFALSCSYTLYIPYMYVQAAIFKLHYKCYLSVIKEGVCVCVCALLHVTIHYPPFEQKNVPITSFSEGNTVFFHPLYKIMYEVHVCMYTCTLCMQYV